MVISTFQSVLRIIRHLCLRDPLEDFPYEITWSTLLSVDNFPENLASARVDGNISSAFFYFFWKGFVSSSNNELQSWNRYYFRTCVKRTGKITSKSEGSELTIIFLFLRTRKILSVACLVISKIKVFWVSLCVGGGGGNYSRRRLLIDEIPYILYLIASR